MSPDFRKMVAVLKLRFWNSNYVGTQFGGAMFAMADPFYMVMLIRNLGPNYRVWDKAATINYIKPGKTDVTATFEISQKDIDDIKEILNSSEKLEWVRNVDIIDANGVVVAQVEKVVHIRKLNQAS